MHHTIPFRLFLLALLAKEIYAAPAILGERSVTQVSAADLGSLAPFTQFARATYCPTNILQDWNCGEACAANPGFQPTIVGGNGNDIQIYFVGFWRDQNSIVVAHEGTDPTKLLADLTDADIIMASLDTKLFPGVPSDIKVHQGFRDQHEKTASTILTEVERLMSATGSEFLVAVGHSLGGALAELDALFLTLNLPSNMTIKAVTYGTPRVGNSAFAHLIDAQVSLMLQGRNLTIKYSTDIIPIVPPSSLGFQHPHGEIHILSPGNAVSCPGDDDGSDPQCQIQSVPDVFHGNILNHLGPYEGISTGTIYCT